jgi:hypothetical protein
MTFPNRVLPILTFTMLAAVSLQAQKTSARDAFWSSSDLITVEPNPAAHKRTVTHAQNTGSAGSQPGASGPIGGLQAGDTLRVRKVNQLVAENGYGSAPHLVRTSEDHLGLRCSVMRRSAAGEYEEVDADSVFHSGDHIRLSFLPNQPGYFYVIQQGSTGAWAPIYPKRNSAPDANKISAGQIQVVPGGKQFFLFDQNPGDEKIFVILSRTPIRDLDRVIQDLQSAQPAAPSQQPAESPQTLEAENRIPDAFVQGLASRDLKLVDEEKEDDSKPQADSHEKAIYVVNKASDPASNSQVVLRLELRHE